MTQADSVEDSKLGVAYGYLAVLLGYLSLDYAVQFQLESDMKWPILGKLIKSIQEFINIYRSVYNKVTELEGLINKLISYKKDKGKSKIIL